MRRLVVDTDPGMDDALALVLALRHPALQVEAITAVTGNLPSPRTAANVLRILDLVVYPPLPVAQGPAEPLEGSYPSDPFSHGSDGLAESYFPDSDRSLDERGAAQLICDTVDLHPQDISIAALGPLTNVALALEIDPELTRKVRDLVIIGGSFGLTPYAFTQATGDNPVSEWNIFVDPEAAHRVLAAGFNITAVGLDLATHPSINFRKQDLTRLRAAGTPVAALALRIVEYVNNRGYQSYCSLIDSVAIAAMIDPKLVTTTPLRVGVERRGELTRGMTVVERRLHHCRDDLPVVQAVGSLDFDRFLDLITEVLSDH